jgi:8-oxo-dGTP diphosphatase
MELDPREAQQSPDFPDAFYRVSIKGLLVRDGKLMMVDDFAGIRSREKGGEWELPGGGLDFGENFQDGLRREIKEETGMTPTWIADKPTYTWIQKRIGRRGMEWFYVLIMAFQFEVDSLDFVPTEECRAIQFMTKDDLRANKDKIGDQLHPLIDLFDPADFTQK